MDRRRYDLEQMEDPALAPHALADAFVGMRRLNRASLGVHWSVAGVERVARGLASWSALDVGCGDGTVLRQLARRAETRSERFEGRGVDLLAPGVELARRLTGSGLPLTFEVEDLFKLDANEARWDVVHTSLVLHHMDDAEAAGAARQMVRLARVGVVINDLHRAPLSWAGAAAGARLVTRSPIVHADAPHSVLRAFRRAEIEAIGAASGAAKVELHWRFPYRWVMTLWR